MLALAISVTPSAKETLSKDSRGGKDDQKFSKFLIRMDRVFTDVCMKVLGLKEEKEVSVWIVVAEHARGHPDFHINARETLDGFVAFPKGTEELLRNELEKATKELLTDSDNADLTVSVQTSY